MPPSRSPLFRREAMKAARTQPYGEIVLLPGAWSAGIAWASILIVVAIAALLAFGSYTRRSTVTGQILPRDGLIRITASQPGVVTETHVREGQSVRRNDVLFVLSGDRAGSGADAAGFQRGIAAQIEARQMSLESELRRLDQAEEQDAAQQVRRIGSLRGESERVVQQGRQQRIRVAGASDAVARYQSLAQQGYVSKDELLAKLTELAQLRAQMEGVQRDAMALERELGTAQREADNLRVRYATQRSELERAILSTRQEYSEIEARRRIVVSAPTDGTITLMRVNVGQSVESAHALAHLVPASSQLVARLYAPSRAAGFIESTRPVVLRLDAFPFQKFGQLPGSVLSVSTAAATAADLNDAAIRPELLAEPLFAITVSLPADGQSTTGHRLPLQVGMKVEADLLHESRRLYEWILEPLLVMRTRL